VAVDSHDNIIVAGYTMNASGNKDYYTIKYSNERAVTTTSVNTGSGNVKFHTSNTPQVNWRASVRKISDAEQPAIFSPMVCSLIM